jgi:hypothetical protein
MQRMSANWQANWKTSYRGSKKTYHPERSSERERPLPRGRGDPGIVYRRLEEIGL